MARFLFAVIPALGHLNPMLTVASELQRRGHHVAFGSGREIEGAIRRAGLPHFPVLPDTMLDSSRDTVRRMLKHRGPLGNVYLIKNILEFMPASIPEWQQLMTEFHPDVVVVDMLTYGAAMVAQALEIPWATFCPIPSMIPSRDAPPYSPWGLPPARNGLARGLYRLLHALHVRSFSMFDQRFNRMRRTMGLEPLSCGVITTSLSPYLVLIPSCQGFEFSRSDWPHQVYLIGTSPWTGNDDSEKVNPDLDLLSGDRPVIFVTLGTFQSHRPALSFFETVVKAFADEPLQVVMAVGQQAIRSASGGVPGNFMVASFIAHEKILPRTSAVVHHGGFGISHDAIYFGVPSVIVPLGQDLFENASRCTEAGVALRIDYRRFNPRRLRQALYRILGDEAIRGRVRRLQTLFQASHPDKLGASLLERLAMEKRPILRSEPIRSGFDQRGVGFQTPPE